MQRNKFYTVILLYMIQFCLGLEFNKQQRYNTNDFLQHETGGNPSEPKRDYVAPSPNNPTGNVQAPGNQDYIAQFPSLGVPSTSPRTTLKLDSRPTNTIPKSQSSSGKRDYVAPQYTSSRPTHETTGRVKDLVNFYDNKHQDQNSPTKVPSYSSILQGSSGNNKQVSTTASLGSTGYAQSVTQATYKRPSTHTTKPLSFSAVVANSNNPSAATTVTTSKPSTQYSSNQKPTRSESFTPVPHSGTPVLPSSVVNRNRNKNNNQGSNSNGPTDVELQTLSEELLRKDVNNAAKYITVNYQEKTTSQSKDDKAPQPLLTVAPETWNIQTIQKFLPLLDNYERDTLINEHVTAQERNEENAFMDAIMATTVIRHLMIFLRDKGYVTPDSRQQRDFLKQLWFGLYSRGKGKISSSGFEHIFVSELKNGEVSGLHNWIYFSREELSNRANYLGYLKYVTLNDKGVVMKLHFNQQGVDKPVDSMFIGTSPELEMALYTLCFVTRADNDCKLKLANKDVEIVTHTFRYRSKNLIGSAYPQI